MQARFQPAGASGAAIDAEPLENARCDAQQIDLTRGAAPAHVGH
jgi:hypothetical protein